jgi:hypothetical protein
VNLLVSEARERGFATGDLGALNTLSIGYQTRTEPITVTEIFDFAEGAGPTQVRYSYRAFKGGPGEMRFVITDTQATPGTLLETLDITSRWTGDAGGVGRVQVLSGDYAGASIIECWDAAFRTSYRRASWEIFGGEGDFRACPTIASFGTPFSS